MTQNDQGCYQCGSEQGTSIRLCPRCTQARIAKNKEMSTAPRFNMQESSSYHNYGNLFGHPLATAGVIAVVIGLSAYFLLFSAYGPGLGMSKGERLYKKCVAKMSSMDTGQFSGGDDLSKAFGQSIMQAFTTGICETIRNECGKATPDPKCDQLLAGM
jgi:hypothetical protein